MILGDMMGPCVGGNAYHTPRDNSEVQPKVLQALLKDDAALLRSLSEVKRKPEAVAQVRGIDSTRL
jgi:hypothetical protein